jgi:hypothetical protein
MADCIMPKDTSGQSLQALLYDDVNARSLALGAASIQDTLPATCTVVTVTASGNCWVKVGTVASPPTAVAGAAGCDYMPAGIKWTRQVAPPAVIAVIQDGAATGYLAVMPALAT